ncbi:DoxX family protein [Nonomuraea maritima]|uniref:DoxX family protein n=1 Tax=Nonomuraea maritima TaxID=683260 RepID=UPI003721CB5B
MFVAYVVVTVVTIVANVWASIADFARARFVLVNAEAVGVSHSWIPLLAVLKAAGAAGLLLGLAGAGVIGLAAAAGLVMFFVGAVATHVRAHVFFPNIAFPGVFLVLAVASLVLAAAR